LVIVEPTFLVPGIQISGFRPKSPGNKVGTFNRKYAPATVGLCPAKLDLAITACAIHVKHVVSRVGARIVIFIIFRLGRRHIFGALGEIPSIRVFFFSLLYLFLKLKVPVMVSLEWAPFLPAFTFRPVEDFPNSINIQFMTAACFTGKFPRLVFVHSYTPSDN
jgi:hypothetical protein